MISFEDEFIVKIVVPGCSLVSCPKKKWGWVVEAVEIVAEYHGADIKYDLVPTVIFDIDITNASNLGIFCNRDAHVGVKDSEIIPTSAVT